MKTPLFLLMLISALILSGCGRSPAPSDVNIIDPQAFRGDAADEPVEVFTLRNNNGAVAQFTNFGARWISLWVPDRDGTMRDVVLGFNTLEEYRDAGEPYHGAIVGRIAGRINNAQFELDGRVYEIAENDLFGEPRRNHLHGGFEGFHVKFWDGRKEVTAEGEEQVVFNYRSPHMEEGFPGNLDVEVRYTLTHDNAITIEYTASTDRPTILNLTNHAFFNLKGEGNGDILDHELVILAEAYIEGDDQLIPTGRLPSVDGTPLDFRQPVPIGDRIHERHSQIVEDQGFALAYAISKDRDPPYQKVSEAYAAASGILMEVYSNQPSLQLYNAWLFDGSDIGKAGRPYVFSGGLALETQQYPDATSHPNFPEIVLRPDETYYHKASYRFSTR